MTAWAAAPLPAQTLAASEWRPLAHGGVPLPAETELFVQFRGEGKLEGFGGCNRFFGSYRLEGERIEIAPLATTRMACDQPIMDLEFFFLDALGQARRAQRDRVDLTLFDDAGRELLRLKQTDWD